MSSGECLGLLGKNGAGKTTTFKMLTSEEEISEGDAWIKSVSVRSKPLQTYKHFGYCPQFEAMMEDLTGKQWMEIVALIRGVPGNQIGDLCKSMAHELGFEKHLRKKVSAMSGGNKRKVSTALALIASPSVVFMDEPTTGMDPGSKRCVWNVVTKYRNEGHSIVLTSHSMVMWEWGGCLRGVNVSVIFTLRMNARHCAHG